MKINIEAAHAAAKTTEEFIDVESLKDSAIALCRWADGLNQNITIELEHVLPLAMGRTQVVVSIWPKRGGAT
jgi:uncharacterized protein Yka (UPF0111/DUF47 family)